MSDRTLFYYDQESNVTCVRDADNGLTYYTYDLLNRMTSVKNPFGEVTYYDYTPGGQVKRRILGNSTLTYYEYDDVGRVSKVDNRKSDMSVISTFEYEHDKVGNPTKIQREDGSATYYQYDRIYQLTGETQVDDQGQVEYAFEYQYDKAHNRTVKVDNGTPTYYAYNEANELTHETTNGQTTSYQYDRCGNTTAKQEPSGTTYYVYDTENLLTRIDFPDASHNYFAYDADSKRVSKEDGDGFTEFIYQGPDMLKLLLERDDQGVTQAHYTMGIPLRQGYGGQVGLEAMRRNTSSGIAAGASSFYHYNHLGTTHELTDASQNITDTYRHDAWGVQLASTGSTLNPHTYVGRERYYRMAGTGLYHLGFRNYRSGTGRFLTIDPGRDGTNWFEYARNAPTLQVDPSGLQSAAASRGVSIDSTCAGYVGAIRHSLSMIVRQLGRGCLQDPVNTDAVVGLITGTDGAQHKTTIDCDDPRCRRGAAWSQGNLLLLIYGPPALGVTLAYAPASLVWSLCQEWPPQVSWTYGWTIAVAGVRLRRAVHLCTWALTHGPVGTPHVILHELLHIVGRKPGGSKFSEQDLYEWVSRCFPGNLPE